MIGFSRLVVVVLLATFAVVGVALAAAPLPFAHWQQFYGGAPNQRLGESVAIDGDVMVVGVPYLDQTIGALQFNNSGSFRIYRWSAGRWTLDRTVTLGNVGSVLPQADARLGTSVAVSGNRILVGCPGCGGGRPKAYLVEVPEPGTSTDLVWHPVDPTVTSPNDPVAGIGATVALSGNIVAVGAPRATFGNPEFGAVALGRFDGAQIVWEYVQYGWQDSRFGQSLAIARTRSGGTLPLTSYTVVVGAPEYVEPGVFGIGGRAMLLHRNASGDWSFGQVFDNPNSGLADVMGSAVAIHRPTITGNAYVAIGARGRGLNGTAFTGTVRIYQRDSDSGQYEFVQEIQHPTPNAYDFFGGALALVDGRLVVGARGRGVGSWPEAGSAYVYERRFVPVLLGYRWLLQQTLAPHLGRDAQFGSAIAMTGNALVIGAPRHESLIGTLEIGSVETYLCDRIFAHGLDSDSADPCAEP